MKLWKEKIVTTYFITDGPAIRAARKAKNLPIKSLTFDAGISMTRLTDIETGRDKGCKEHVMKKLEEVLK